MSKIDSVITQLLASVQDDYPEMSAELFQPGSVSFQAPGPNNDVERALSLIQAFGNTVFISESEEQGDRLAAGVSAHLAAGGIYQQAVRIDAATLAGASEEQAGVNFKNIIYRLRGSEKKIGLVIANLQAIAENEQICSVFRDALRERPMPIIGLTNMKGFRRLEERPGLSGSLQFILAENEGFREKRDKSVLIIGASSFFGKAVYQLFSQKYRDVKGTGFSRAASLNFDKLDVTDEGEVKKYFSEHPHFDLVVYISGEANADVAEKEKDRAKALNSEAVLSISRCVKGGKFVYISSEYVFDGNSGPYGSGSRANPINYYGRTKLEGEKFALENFSNALVLRLGALYGYNGPNDKGTTVSKIIACLGKTEPLEADNLQVKHPLLLEDAAMALYKLLDYGASGIYQVNGAEGLNKLEMSERIALVWSDVTGRAFSYPIIGVEQPGVAGKPLNTHMVNVDTPRLFSEGVRFMLLKQAVSGRGKGHGY